MVRPAFTFPKTALQTIQCPWTELRSVVSTALDWPTTTGSYNPATDPTHRLVTRMIDKVSAALPKIDFGGSLHANALQLRTRFSTGGASTTFYLFSRRKDDLSVKLVAAITVAAGSQTDTDGKFFGSTMSVISYWPKAVTPSIEPSGSGMGIVEMDIEGWPDWWVGVPTLSAGTLYIDFATL